jgi:hypothetical protein
VVLLINVLVVIASLSSAILPQQPRGVIPTFAGGAVPLYPPLARAARVEGTVHVRVTTDGTKVVDAHAEDGHKLLTVAAEENARTWQFSKHEPTTFTVLYRYRLDADADPNNPTVTLRPPREVDVSIGPLVISDPPARIK